MGYFTLQLSVCGVQNVNFVEKHAKFIKVLSVFQATLVTLNVSGWSKYFEKSPPCLAEIFLCKTTRLFSCILFLIFLFLLTFIYFLGLQLESSDNISHKILHKYLATIYVTFNVKSFKNIYEILRICLAWKSVKLTRLHKDKMCLHRTKNVNNCQTIIAMKLSLKSLAQWKILPNYSFYAYYGPFKTKTDNLG